jgi:hypothetical protein
MLSEISQGQKDKYHIFFAYGKSREKKDMRVIKALLERRKRG